MERWHHEKNRKIRIKVVRETDYGDRFKLFLITSPGGIVGQKALGLELEQIVRGYNVGNIRFNGPAEKAKLEFGDIITAVEVEEIFRPAKEFVYPIALLILAGVISLQLVRRSRSAASHLA